VIRSTPALLSRRTALAAAALVLGLSLVPLAAPRAEDGAAATVQGFNNALLEVMKNGKALGYQGRFTALKPAFEKAFDVAFMTRFVAASAWDGASEDQKKALTRSFVAYSVASYARNFKAFDGESFPIDGAREIPQGTMVASRIVPKDGKPVAMNYLLRKTGGAWRVIDVFLDGTISQLATRRTDFAKPLAEGKIPALVALLDGKVKEMAEGQ
jgi:phospholipid transport system substrate-binding protein